MKIPSQRNRLFWILLAGGAGIAAARGQDPDLAAATAFLRANRVALPLAPEPRPAIALVAPSPAKIFLVGELLGVAETNPTDLALLSYLHDAARVRTYLGELSHAHAELLNDYLGSGDTRILDFIFEQMEGSIVCSREKRQSWIDLRRWNLRLPPNERITIVGVDLERFRPELTLAYLRRLLRAGSRNPAVAQAGSLIDAAGPHPPPEAARALADALAARLGRGRADYAAALGPRLFDYELALRNLEDRYRCYADPTRFDQLRDRVMYENLCLQERHRPLGPMFGRIGSGHVLQRRFDGVDRLGELLAQEGSPWKGRVASFFPLYASSRHLATDGRPYHAEACDDDPRLLAPFLGAASGPVTLFRLAGPLSPFDRDRAAPGEVWRWGSNQLRFAGAPNAVGNGRLFGGFDGGVATDYFQYVVLFEGARANTAFAPSPAANE